MDKIKKLSEAIRLGATFRPQCFGQYFENGGSCAIGAAIEAIGLAMSEWKMDDELYRRFKVHPGNHDAEAVALWKTISRMNDSRKTREQIADWLESQGL